jgi:arginase
MTIDDLRKRLNQGHSGSLSLIGIPSDTNSSFLQGAAEAPPFIREALFSDSANMWTETGIDLGVAGTIFDAGDLLLEDTPWETAEEAIGLLLKHDLPPIVLGGDHAISYPVVRAFQGNFPQLSILHFDAHPDLYDDFENNPNSHASPFARIMENGLARRLVQVGIRTATGHQREQAKRFGVEMIEMRQFGPDTRICFDGPVYVSVDIDGLDPAYAPGVSHPEPGGLSTRQVLDVIQTFGGKLVGADIVEVNPRKDVNNITSIVAAKIVKEVAARIIFDR